MALSAKLSSLSLEPDISSGRMPAGGRNVASIGSGAVEEISPKAGPQANENQNFMGFSKWLKGREPTQRERPRDTTGRFHIQSSAFLGLLAQYQLESDTSRQPGTAKGAFQGALSKAIRAYEGTAAVIHAQNAPRGSSISLTL